MTVEYQAEHYKVGRIMGRVGRSDANRIANAVIHDLVSFPKPCFGIVHNGYLLPMRYNIEIEAIEHLASLMQEQYDARAKSKSQVEETEDAEPGGV